MACSAKRVFDRGADAGARAAPGHALAGEITNIFRKARIRAENDRLRTAGPAPVGIPGTPGGTPVRQSDRAIMGSHTHPVEALVGKKAEGRPATRIGWM